MPHGKHLNQFRSDPIDQAVVSVQNLSDGFNPQLRNDLSGVGKHPQSIGGMDQSFHERIGRSRSMGSDVDPNPFKIVNALYGPDDAVHWAEERKRRLTSSCSMT